MAITWTPGDVSGAQTLTDDDHLYPGHINELRTAINSGSAVTTSNSLVDGQGYNYQISTSVYADDLTIALKTLSGTDPSSTDKSVFCVGTQIIEVSSALSVTIDNAYGDVFGHDTPKIQGNDIQLFPYIINNNGVAQLGVSWIPNLTVVATNYIDAGGQTGTAGYSNIVMSGTRDTNNSCRVIGRFNALQGDDDTWQSPSISNVYSSPIFETDRMEWDPAAATTAVLSGIDYAYYTIKRKKLSFFIYAGSKDLSGTTAPIGLYLPVQPAINYNFQSLVYDGSSWAWNLAWSLYGYAGVYKGSGNWNASETGVTIFVSGEYDI